MDDLPPVTFAGLRFLAAAALLWAILGVSRKKLPNTKEEWVIICITSLLTIAIPYSLQFWGQQYVPSGLAAVMFATVPFFTMLFAHVALPDDPFTFRRFFGVVLGIVGVGLIFADQLKADSEYAFWGCLAFLTGAVTHALAQVIIKARGQKIEPLVLASSQILLGGILLFVLGVSLEGNPLNIRWTVPAALSLAYLAFFGSALAFFMFYWLLRRLKVTTVTAMALVHPLVAVGAGWIALNERLGFTVLIGGVAVLAGLALILFVPASKDSTSNQ